MQFMMIVKANRETEAGVIPSEELLAAMTKDNEENDKVTVVDGPFAETKEWIG